MKIDQLLAVVLILLCSGCERAGDERRADAAHRLERIRSELGIEPPTHLLGVHFLDDGGSAVVEVADARGESLLIVADNRLYFEESVDSAGHRVPLPPPARFTYLHQYPTTPGARRLEFRSRAESAVVDLLRLQLRVVATVREESALVRRERRAQLDENPSYALSVWRQTLEPHELNVLGLRRVVAGIESRRRAGGVFRAEAMYPEHPADSATPP